ncbi:hypothetical protein H0X48_01900 [Candidatus Dependentiae bacterium]|nr:hypothetical protein [Candidatus Dependentiae bacterium]
MNAQQPFAEVIESSLTIWRAQTWQWDNFPSFGSLVTLETETRVLFGLVYFIQTGSLDPSRTAYAYKKTEAELKRDQPQIFEFLHTTFSCLTIGYLEKDKLLYQLAPEPPKIHAFVCHANHQQIVQFFSHEHYLHILFEFSHHLFSLDELLLALLKNLSDNNALTQENLSKFIETFSLLTANDYRRLKLFLQRAHTIIKLTD